MIWEPLNLTEVCPTDSYISACTSFGYIYLNLLVALFGGSRDEEPPRAHRNEEEYDFVVVGAGSAGCVVANRLTENPNWKTMRKFASLFLQHTMATRSHLTPELVLRLVTPECPLWRARESPFVDPYWAFYWPGGQATARYILDNKDVIRGRRVLEVGCGCGAGAIAAATAGAARVLANDIDPDAEIATKMNAKINNVNLETDTKNYIGTNCEEFDTILIGDMFYDEDFGNMLFTWLKQLTERDTMVLIGDPGRHGLTSARLDQLTLLARYDMPRDSCDQNNGFTETSVFKLNK